MSDSSKIYAPYQVLGLVNDGKSTECLPTIHRQGLSSFITTPVDDARALHLYDINLRLKGVTKPLHSTWIETSGVSQISRIAAYNEVTCVALGSCIGVFFRFRPLCLWTAHEAPIKVFGMAGNVLISISRDGNLIAWLLPSSAKDPPSREGNIVTNLRIPAEYEVTCVAHPHSYKNKVLLGTRDGRCLLLNLKSGKIIHVFAGFGSSITALEPAPVLDVVAVGTVSGDIHLHNFRVDETIVTLKHTTDEKSSQETSILTKALGVQAITFRTDADESLLTADGDGNLYVWDLNEKSLRCDVRHVHGNGAMFVRFLPGEPIFVSAGLTDNSVKVHIFEETSGQPRVLRSRDGHHLPPICVRFCGHDGFSIVSAGMDREVRLVSAVNEARNRPFAQFIGSKPGGKPKKRRRVNVVEDMDKMNKKLPPVVSLVSCNRRERDGEFANIITIHEGMEEAHTWRLQHGVKYKHVLKPPVRPLRLELAFQRAKQHHVKSTKKSKAAEQPRQPCATSAALTPCGTFAVIGMENGKIHSYNLQSGRHLGAYRDQTLTIEKLKNEETAKSEWGFAHEGPVVGLAVDAYGDSIVSAGSQDRSLKFWNTHTRELLPDAIVPRSKAILVQWCKVSDLIAVACEDFIVYIYDAATHKLARRFSGHQGPIVDLCFDTLGRRIVSASTDSTVKVWDLPSGCLMDTIVCTNAPTSIAMAPSGDYLASTHVNNLSVRLWVDKSKFGGILPQETHEDSTATRCENDDSEVAVVTSGKEASLTKSPEERTSDPGEEVPPLSKGIVTLSVKPTSQWTVLSNLKQIRERSKPSEPAQKPASTPFFLPTKKGLRFEFDTGIPNEEEEDGSEEKRIRKSNDLLADLPPSNFGKLVIAGKFEEAAKLLGRLDPSGVDMEINTVGGQLAKRKAAEYFRQRLQTLCDYELCHAHLSVFLRAHGVALANDSEGLELISKLMEAHESTWEKLRGSMDAVSCLSAYFSGQV